MKRLITWLDEFLGNKFWIRLFLFMIAVSIPLKIYFAWKGRPEIISDVFAGILCGLVSFLAGANTFKKNKNIDTKEGNL